MTHQCDYTHNKGYPHLIVYWAWFEPPIKNTLSINKAQCQRTNSLLDECLVFVDLSEIFISAFVTDDIPPNAIDHSKTMVAQGKANMPMIRVILKRHLLHVSNSVEIK